jgi:phosphoribosylformylglycinamidine synthase
MAVLDDVRKCVTMDLKNRTARVVLVSSRDTKLETLAKTHRGMAKQIAAGRVSAAHDVSDGGVAVAAAEMCIASGLGMIIGSEHFMTDDAFAERPGRYLVELKSTEDRDAFAADLAGVADVADFGLVHHLRKLTVTSPKERVVEIGLDELTNAWRGTLDW